MLTIHEEQGFVPTRRTVLIKDENGKVYWHKVCAITDLDRVLELASKVLAGLQPKER